MKKLILIFGILLYCSGIVAQDSSQEKGSEKDKRLPVIRSSYKNYIRTVGDIPEYFLSGRRGDDFFETFTPNVIPEYFFLGTLSPLPEIKKFFKENKVDEYREDEQPLVEYMEKYFLEIMNISITVKQEENRNNRIGIYSGELMEIKRTFFDKETGALKEDIFHTDEEIASYLLGVYFRFGRKTEKDNYELSFSGIFIGMEKMFSLLLRMKARKVIYLNAPPKEEESPTEDYELIFDLSYLDYNKFLFEPSRYLEKYLDTMKEEKEKLPYIYIYF